MNRSAGDADPSVTHRALERLLFCLRTGLQNKFIGGGFQLQILFAADKGDDTKDQNHEEKEDGDVRPGNFWHEHSVVPRPSVGRTLLGGDLAFRAIPPVGFDKAVQLRQGPSLRPTPGN